MEDIKFEMPPYSESKKIKAVLKYIENNQVEVDTGNKRFLLPQDLNELIATINSLQSN